MRRLLGRLLRLIALAISLGGLVVVLIGIVTPFNAGGHRLRESTPDSDRPDVVYRAELAISGGSVHFMQGHYFIEDARLSRRARPEPYAEWTISRGDPSPIYRPLMAQRHYGREFDIAGFACRWFESVYDYQFETFPLNTPPREKADEIVRGGGTYIHVTIVRMRWMYLQLPTWAAVVLALLYPMSRFRKMRRVRREAFRQRNDLCLACGYDLRTQREHSGHTPVRCPECGTEPECGTAITTLREMDEDRADREAARANVEKHATADSPTPSS